MESVWSRTWSRIKSRIANFPRLLGLQLIVITILLSPPFQHYLVEYFPIVFHESILTCRNIAPVAMGMYIGVVGQLFITYCWYGHQAIIPTGYCHSNMDGGASSNVSDELKISLMEEIMKREHLQHWKRQLQEHLNDLNHLQLYHSSDDDASDRILQSVLVAVADMFERQVTDKQERIELAHYIDTMSVVICYRRLVDRLQRNTRSPDNKWLMYRDLCRSIRVPCCECQQFARKMYKCGIVCGIAKILNDEELKCRYTDSQVTLDLVSIGLLLCAVCCSNVCKPTPVKDFTDITCIADYYEQSTIHKVRHASQMLSKVVDCLPSVVKEKDPNTHILENGFSRSNPTNRILSKEESVQHISKDRRKNFAVT